MMGDEKKWWEAKRNEKEIMENEKEIGDEKDEVKGGEKW
jgi:hypothetical protein